MKHFLNDELVSIDNWSTTCSKYLTHVASIVIHNAGHEIRHRPVLVNFDMSGSSDLIELRHNRFKVKSFSDSPNCSICSKSKKFHF